MFCSNDIHVGERVYDLNGKEVGHVSDVHEQTFDVSTGFLGLQQLTVPCDEVDRVADDIVYLAVPKNQIGNPNAIQHPRPSEPEGQFTDRGETTGSTDATNPPVSETNEAESVEAIEQVTEIVIIESDGHEEL